MPQFVNLTPHVVSVLDVQGVQHDFAPSGSIARVSSVSVSMPVLNGFPVSRVEMGQVEGVAAPSEGTVFIVSAMVRAAMPERSDVVSPDTGSTAIRNEKGHIVAVRGFVSN